MKDEIKNILSINVPKEYEQYFEKNIQTLKQDEEIIIEVKHLSNDWKYSNYKFWMLKDIQNEVSNVYAKENTNKLSIAKTSEIISSEIKQEVLCIAWSHNSIERDTGLFYLENRIYGYSLNFSDNYKLDLIAENLNQLLNSNSKEVKTIEDIVDSHAWYLCDQECLTDGQEYKSLLKSYFEDTSNNKVKLSNINIKKNKEDVIIEMDINKQKSIWKLNYNNGWIDDKIVSLMNRFLRRSNLKERFYILKNPNWGQELGVAFCSKEQSIDLESNNLLR